MIHNIGQHDFGCLIRFIPAHRNNTDVENAAKAADTNQQKLSGDEARTFYEDLLKDGQSCKEQQKNKSDPFVLRYSRGRARNTRIDQRASTSVNTDDLYESKNYGECQVSRKRPKTKLTLSSSIKQDETVCIRSQSQVHNKLLAFSQNGDLLGLKKLFESEINLDLDHTDQYGWTSLMCATVARHKKVVEYLLYKGANRNIRNSNGKSAFDLAKDLGATKILDIFIGRKDKQPMHIKTERNPLFYCETCKANFSESTEKQHSSSTVHLFNLKLKPKSDPFMLPESNIGYQLMRNSGWDGEAGLGPGGKGAKFPVKTVLKTDRLCLGSEQIEKKKPKITHFGPNDPESVSSIHRHSVRVLSARASSRKEQRRRERKDKQWERNLRQYWNMDCDSITLDKL